MPTNPVHFGTDGWRAIIADTFTFENVRACARAIAEHFAEHSGTSRPLIVGYDTRFLSDHFAREIARVLAGAGFTVQLADRPAPTPAISYRIIQTRAAGGVVVTSSHNPYNWNGIKVKPHYGGSASPEIVADIEQRVPAILAQPTRIQLAPANTDTITQFDPIPDYLTALGRQVDLQRIRSAGLTIAIDPMYGAGAGLYGQLLSGGSTTIHEIHAERNPAFPGIRAPEPIESNLTEFLHLVRTGHYHAGIANDGDADRVGLVDENGHYIDQLRTFALLIHHLLGQRNLRGPIVRSITTTQMADRLAQHYGVECYETPVGFKHIGPLMIEKNALIGGEESGGYGFRGHLPERDGILAGLYLLDYIAATGKPPSQLLQDLFAITGPHYYARDDYQLEPDQRETIRTALDTATPTHIAGRPVTRTDRTDGWRIHFQGGWLLFRLSGTEPLLRIYTEVTDQALLRPTLEAGRTIAGVQP